MGDDHTTDWLDDSIDYEWLDQDTRDPNEILKDHIGMLVQECQSGFNDGGGAAHYKKQIYQMKCWIDEIYAMLPVFDDEKDWEKERVFDKLKGSDDGRKK